MKKILKKLREMKELIIVVGDILESIDYTLNRLVKLISTIYLAYTSIHVLI